MNPTEYLIVIISTIGIFMLIAGAFHIHHVTKSVVKNKTKSEIEIIINETPYSFYYHEVSLQEGKRIKIKEAKSETQEYMKYPQMMYN